MDVLSMNQKRLKTLICLAVEPRYSFTNTCKQHIDHLAKYVEPKSFFSNPLFKFLLFIFFFKSFTSKLDLCFSISMVFTTSYSSKALYIECRAATSLQCGCVLFPGFATKRVWHNRLFAFWPFSMYLECKFPN